MENKLEKLEREVAFYDRYISTLRQEIEAKQYELARAIRVKQQKMSELSRLRTIRRVKTVKEAVAV